ncbi:MAG: restriction endonuclease subunit S [Acidobacteria bacterium]|nr:restriction endonuclease subunit S [Acidobacteriota bacterium]MCW5969420.1 restriction endonuclease subunit S [Blastocatellales bacterium]
MSRNWVMTPLGDVLSKSNEWIDIDPNGEYRQVTVKLWGKGVVQRDQVSGAEIAGTRRISVRANQFIMSRIDARNGAIGIVPDSLDGAIVSNDFPVFTPDTSRLIPEYLGWLSMTADFVAFCRAASEGTTNRVRLKEDRFLATKIPLPPLDEQRRIVSRIEELAAKIEEAKNLQQQAEADSDAVLRSIIFDALTPSVPTPMKELVRLKEPDVFVQQGETYHFAGVYCFGRGVFSGQSKSGMEFAYPRLTTLKVGDFVYPKLMAWEGALGIVPAECDGLVVSTEFPVFEVDEIRVLPETLDVYFRTPSVWPILAGESTGTNVRRRRLNPTDFLNFKMPLPPMEVQQRLRRVKHHVDSMKRLRSETSAELEALLPSILDKAFKGDL